MAFFQMLGKIKDKTVASKDKVVSEVSNQFSTAFLDRHQQQKRRRFALGKLTGKEKGLGQQMALKIQSIVSKVTAQSMIAEQNQKENKDVPGSTSQKHRCISSNRFREQQHSNTYPPSKSSSTTSSTKMLASVLLTSPPPQHPIVPILARPQSRHKRTSAMSFLKNRESSNSNVESQPEQRRSHASSTPPTMLQAIMGEDRPKVNPQNYRSHSLITNVVTLLPSTTRSLPPSSSTPSTTRSLPPSSSTHPPPPM